MCGRRGFQGFGEELSGHNHPDQRIFSEAWRAVSQQFGRVMW